jgi:hypothetical protein
MNEIVCCFYQNMLSPTVFLHCAKCFPHIKLLNPQNIPLKEAIIIFILQVKRQAQGG